MLNGEFPKECDYCWKVEGLGKHNVSDRVFKSNIYSIEDLKRCQTEFKASEDVDLKTLEIAFDSNCNFACSYCNPSFSTTWQGDIKASGPYQNMVSDGAAAYQQDGAWTIPYGLKNVGNPYIQAFWEWWESDLQSSLTELRITGGEATMSADFWRLMDWWKEHPDCNVRLAVNSNLGAKKHLIERLAETTHSFKEFDLYTSNESFGEHAEYIRDGLVWDTWLENMTLMLEKGNLRSMHVMMTINGLCLFSLVEFMEEMFKLKELYPTKGVYMSFNILRFPSFMATVTLPPHIREQQADKLENWLGENQDRKHFASFEKDSLRRLIDYIRKTDVGHNHTSSLLSRERDFKSFHVQYDSRRGKNFRKTFADQELLLDWYNSIPETDLEVKQVLVNGSSSGYTDQLAEELSSQAEKEGWVLTPQGANPGSQEFIE